MKTSISIVESAGKMVPFVLRGDYVNSIEFAKELGYDAVEIHVVDPKTVDVSKIKKVCLKKNILVSSIGTGMSYSQDKLSLMSEDYNTRLAAIKRVKDFIILAKELNSKVIIGLIRGIIKSDSKYLKSEERVYNSLGECLNFAEKNNVKLVVEAINRYESNFLNTLNYTKRFIEKFNSKYIEVMIDSFHMNIEEKNMEEAILMCGNKIGHVHFSDNDRMYPGHGHINFKSIIKALKKVEYDGFIAIECLSLPVPYEAAKNSIKYLNQVMDN
ncbi:MAG: sugar phosphate isomerase/epimerase [Clostridiales bacterium]